MDEPEEQLAAWSSVTQMYSDFERGDHVHYFLGDKEYCGMVLVTGTSGGYASLQIERAGESSVIIDTILSRSIVGLLHWDD